MPEQVLWPRPRRSQRTRACARALALCLLWLWLRGIRLDSLSVLSVEDADCAANGVLAVQYSVLRVGGGRICERAWWDLFRCWQRGTPIPLSCPPPRTAIGRACGLAVSRLPGRPGRSCSHDRHHVPRYRCADAGDLFDVFILSDTQDAQERLSESRIYANLRVRTTLICRFIFAGALPTPARRPETSVIGSSGSAPHIRISSFWMPTASCRQRFAASGGRYGRQSARGLDSDGSAPGWRPDRYLRAYSSLRPATTAGSLRPGSLLGTGMAAITGATTPSSEPVRSPFGRPAAIAGRAASRRVHPEPRFRGGCTSAARWLGGSHGAFA